MKKLLICNYLCFIILITAAVTAEARFTNPQSNSRSLRQSAGQTASNQIQKAEDPVTKLITQGKYYYRVARFQNALEKFEEALKVEPYNDEALGLAAVTSFRLDNQKSSREYFRRRADLDNQKESVKAFCYYRVAQTYWREVHDSIGKYGTFSQGRVSYNLPGNVILNVMPAINEGLRYIDRALSITSDFTEALNVRNLLHAEAYFLSVGSEEAEEHRRQSAEALRRAIDLFEIQDTGRRGEGADFSQPTFRVGEFPPGDAETASMQDVMWGSLEGGRPVTRVQPSFSARALKRKPNEVTNTTGSQNNSQSIEEEISTVKIEVLVSTSGDVVFAHLVDGDSALAAAATMAARRWKFEPARFEGRPVQVSGVITFEKKVKR